MGRNLFLQVLNCMQLLKVMKNVPSKDSIMTAQTCSKTMIHRQSLSSLNLPFRVLFWEGSHYDSYFMSTGKALHSEPRNFQKRPGKCICVRSKPFKSELLSALKRVLPWVVPGLFLFCLQCLILYNFRKWSKMARFLCRPCFEK